jgi:hypothetical protein
VEDQERILSEALLSGSKAKLRRLPVVRAVMNKAGTKLRWPVFGNSTPKGLARTCVLI